MNHSSIRVMPCFGRKGQKILGCPSLPVAVTQRTMARSCWGDGFLSQSRVSLEGQGPQVLSPLGLGRRADGSSEVSPGQSGRSLQSPWQECLQSGDVLISHKFIRSKVANHRPEPRRLPLPVNYVFSPQHAMALGRNTPWHAP